MLQPAWASAAAAAPPALAALAQAAASEGVWGLLLALGSYLLLFSVVIWTRL